MNIMEIIQNNLYVFLVMGAAIVVSIVYSVVRLNNMKSTNKSFLSQHPDAAKVYLTTKALITAEAVTVHSVNDAAPIHFSEGGKTGFYVVPGKSTVAVSYTYSRPGVMHKTVTTSTDVVQKVPETEPRASYLLGFDRKAENFTFEPA
jgi:hypothetical protein